MQEKIMTKIANRVFKNVSQFKYLRTAVTNPNLIQVKIKRRPNSSYDCYHSLLSPHMLSKNVIIRIHKTSVWLVGLYGYQTWSLGLREGYRLRVFENGMLKRIFGLKRNEVMRGWRQLHDEELHDLFSSSHT
jgi:hypothetical protein